MWKVTGRIRLIQLYVWIFYGEAVATFFAFYHQGCSHQGVVTVSVEEGWLLLGHHFLKTLSATANSYLIVVQSSILLVKAPVICDSNHVFNAIQHGFQHGTA